MLDFRIAFQGGGANLVTLLAAASAVYDLHNDENEGFTVKKISGTSAGSIAAGILATGLNPIVVCNCLKNNGDQWLNEFSEIPNAHGLFPNPWAWGKKAASVAAGNPFLKYDVLMKFIAEILNLHKTSNDSLLKDVKIPLLVTTTDLKRGRVKYWDSQDKQDKDTKLNTVIADSCAFPVVFKSILRSGESRYIDGGLVENLPLIELTKGYSSHQVIGITFEPPAGDVALDSVHAYLGAILSAIIGSNVDDSARSIPATNLIKLPRKFETFGFARALKEGLGTTDDPSLTNYFDEIKELTKRKLQEIIKIADSIEFHKETKSRFSRDYDAGRSAGDIFELFETSGITICNLEIDWTLSSLCDHRDAARTSANPMVTRYEIKKPQQEKTLAFRINLYSAVKEVSLTSNEIDVSYEGGKYKAGERLGFTPLVGTPEEFSKAYTIPVYLYIDLTGLPSDCENIVVRHTDYIPGDLLPKFLSSSSENNLDYEDAALICTYDHYENITYTVHMPESAHKVCDFELIEKLDEEVEYNHIVKGTLNKDHTVAKNRPQNFVTVEWHATEVARENNAAGFVIKKNSDFG